MLDILLQPDLFGKLIEISINTGTDITALARLLQQLDMLTLAPAYYRRQQLDPGALRQLQNLIHHLVNGLLFDLTAAFRTMRNANAGIEKTHVIVDFRNRTHSRTRIAVGRFLVNGDGRGKSLNALHIRLFHLAKELPCVRGQRLHITPLPFCINRIKGQGGLPRAAQARQHHQLVSGNVQGYMFQVVLIRTTNLDILLCHGCKPFSSDSSLVCLR